MRGSSAVAFERKPSASAIGFPRSSRRDAFTSIEQLLIDLNLPWYSHFSICLDVHSCLDELNHVFKELTEDISISVSLELEAERQLSLPR